MPIEEAPNWLRISLGKAIGPQPPLLDSERIKSLVGRALLEPRKISVSEIQEMAASILGYLKTQT